jgi:hypothetical protein
MDNNYQEFVKIFPNFTGTLYLYISGSQGVSPAGCTVEYGKDFKTVEDLISVFTDFIDENAWDNIDSYLEDCDNDEEEAMGEAVADSGNFLVGISEDKLTHYMDWFDIEPLSNIE